MLDVTGPRMKFSDRLSEAINLESKTTCCFARSFCDRTKITIIDEPLSNLDQNYASQAGMEIKRIQRKLGINYCVRNP